MIETHDDIDARHFAAHAARERLRIVENDLPEDPQGGVWEGAVEPEAVKDAPRFISLPDRARALAHQGVHLPTGFATLDTATRGGPRLGSLVVIGGAPGAGKTTFTVNIARALAASGVHVGILAADESADGLLIRIGQSFGYDRDALESASGDLAAFAHDLGADLPTLILGDAYDGLTIEDVAAKVRETAGTAPSALVVDSMQTARTMLIDPKDDRRGKVDAVVAALKTAARSGMLVIATSEVNRGAYRNSDAADRPSDLASYKESGGIEFGVDVALVMRNVQGSPDLVDVSCPKSRTGVMKDFRLSLDRVHATFTETDAGQQAADDGERRARINREEACNRVLVAIGRTPGMTSLSQVAAKAGGRKADTMQAIHVLLADRRIAQEAGRVFRIVAAGDAE